MKKKNHLNKTYLKELAKAFKETELAEKGKLKLKTFEEVLKSV